MKKINNQKSQHLFLFLPTFFFGIILFLISFEVVYEDIITILPTQKADLSQINLQQENQLIVDFELEDKKEDIDISLENLVSILPEPNYKVHVDLINQKLCLEAYGDYCAREYPVSTGERETPTPVGEFQIYRKQDLRVSGLDLPYRMPHYMAFTPNEGYGLHALPYLGGKSEESAFWQEARSHIGIPVSHGCVRILPEDAEEIFNIISVGTPVIIN